MIFILGLLLNGPIARNPVRDYEDDIFWLIHEHKTEEEPVMKVSAIANPSYLSDEPNENSDIEKNMTANI